MFASALLPSHVYHMVMTCPSSHSAWSQRSPQPRAVSSLHKHCLDRTYGTLLFVTYSWACLETSSLFLFLVLKCLIQSNTTLYSHSIYNFSLVWDSFKLGNLQYKRKMYCLLFSIYSMFISYFLGLVKICRIRKA